MATSKITYLSEEPYEMDQATGAYGPRSVMGKSPFISSPDELGPVDRGKENGNTGRYHEGDRDTRLPDPNGDAT